MMTDIVFSTLVDWVQAQTIAAAAGVNGADNHLEQYQADQKLEVFRKEVRDSYDPVEVVGRLNQALGGGR